MRLFFRKNTKKAVRPGAAAGALKEGSFRQALAAGLFCGLSLFFSPLYAASEGRAESAPQRTSGAAESAMEKADLLFLLAERARLAKDPQTALSRFKQALLFQDSPFIRKKLISIYKSEGLSSKALFHYRAMLKQSAEEEESYAAHSALSEFFAGKGLFKEALRENDAACQNAPAGEEAPCGFRKALLLQAAGRPQKALRTLKAQRRPFSKEREISSLLLKSQIYWEGGSRAPARRMLLRAAAKSHNAGNAARRGIAALFIQRGDLKAAGDYLAKDEDLELLRARAEIFQALNDKPALYAQLKKIEAADILESFEALSMARLLMERGDYQRARLFLEDLLWDRRFAASAHYFLGFILEKTGKLDQAQSRYLKAGAAERYFLEGRIKRRPPLKEAGRAAKGLKKRAMPQEA